MTSEPTREELVAVLEKLRDNGGFATVLFRISDDGQVWPIPGGRGLVPNTEQEFWDSIVAWGLQGWPQ